MHIHTETHIVRTSEIDDLNHVNNVVYLQWINNISIAHWNKLASQTIKEKYIWVAIRHEIDYLKAAFLEDNIRLDTWVVSLEGVKSIRKVEIYRGDVLIAKSKTTWCLLNSKTQKLTRITREIKDLF